jgi:hypothetical protein
MSDTCKVFDILHMLWMCIWMRPNNIPAAPADKALGTSHLEIWVTSGQQMMVKCSDWGCRPNQDWSHINVRHMQGVWHPSYAVDVNMDASLQHSSSPCWQSFGNKSPRNLGNFRETNSGEVQWLRPLTQLKLIPHQCQTHARCLTTFICSGCEYGCVLTTFQQPLLTKLWEQVT